MDKKATQHAAVQAFLNRRVREGEGRGTFQYDYILGIWTQQYGLLFEAIFLLLYRTLRSTLTAVSRAYINRVGFI